MQHESVMKVPNAPLVQELLRSPLLGPGGLLARWLVLGECQHSPATVSDIARRLHLARQSVQRVADVLQREGLCTYRDNPRHRRAKLVELTPAGRSALTRIEAAQRHWSDALAARIGQRVLRQAHAALAPGGRGGGAGRRAHGMRSSRGDPGDWIARRRLHGLLLRGPRPPAPEDVVGHLTAMQAQEHPYARWSVAQRTAGSPSASAVDASFDEGRIIRTHVLRPTWHYVAARDLRWLIGLSGSRVDAANARRHRELGLDAPTLNRSTDVLARAVASGARTRRELAAILEMSGISVAGQRMAYMLMHAELTAVICSGGMRGTQHTYAAFDDRVPAGRGLEGDEPLAELTCRYFSTRGPATLSDFSWWSGLRAPEARRGLQMVGSRLDSHEVDGRTYWLFDQGTHRRSSRIDLVQCYDEVIISYNQSRNVLHTPSARFPVPRHLDGFQHVLLLDGRLLGHWRVSADSDGVRIETRTNGGLDRKAQIALGRAIERYQRFAQPR